MQIKNEFSLDLPPDKAYALLLDLERVTPCVPGAELGPKREDGSHKVKLTVKLGPMKFVYDGSVQIAERDETARRAVMVGQARETSGQGDAKATIAMTVTGQGNTSQVSAIAEVGITGRAAQMGRGMVDDVAKKMIVEMANCLKTRFAQP
ncbi:MAG: SRPBCC family protein [Candidatus Binatia bacterium]